MAKSFRSKSQVAQQVPAKKKLTMFAPTVFSKHGSHDVFRRGKTQERLPLGLYNKRVLVSFGSTTATPAGHVRINSVEGVKNASNKVTTKKFCEALKIPTQKYIVGVNTKTAETIIKEITDKGINYPVVAKQVYGYGGAGMFKLENEAELREFKTKTLKETYFIEEVFQDNIKKCREYRIHVAPLLVGVSMEYTITVRSTDESGKVTTKTETITSNTGEVSSARKKMTEEGVKKKFFGRNVKLGHAFFTYSFSKEEAIEKRNVKMDWNAMVAACVALVKELGLDLAAVDILWDSETGNFTILEVNSAPSMGDITDNERSHVTAQVYKKALRKIIEIKLK